MNKKLSKCGFVITLALFMFLAMGKDSVKAATKSYGIIIGNAKSQYTYYDLNGAKGTQRIEKNSAGKVMVPVKKVCSYMPAISYSYNWDTSKATLKNTKNGKKVVLVKNSKYIYTYASKKAKAKKVKLSAKCYISSGSKALMAETKIFQYVFAKTTGFKSYSKGNKTGKAAISKALYNRAALAAIIVYNPYKAVSSIPKATAVKYVSQKDLSNIVKVTIPEGYSAAQIANLLVHNGVCQSTSAILKACNAVSPSSYWFLKDVKKSSHRCYYIEGYLFPSTYEFYKNTSPADAIAKMLKNTSNKLTTTQKTRAKKLGYTMDQIMTIASIIEKEASVAKEQPYVSSVLHNRLKKSMKIQCDVTINYVEKYLKPYISGDKNRFNEYYNTYKCKALPSGPICNPGIQAITAALYPKTTNYLYFCTDTKGKYYYAETWEEHTANLAIIKKNK